MCRALLVVTGAISWSTVGLIRLIRAAMLMYGAGIEKQRIVIGWSVVSDQAVTTHFSATCYTCLDVKRDSV